MTYRHSLTSLVATLPLAVILATIAIPAAQAGDFEVGCKLYTAKDYKGAKASFEKVVKAYPNFALAHYYLGNILMSSGQSAQAKQEYQLCLDGHPDATTAGYCQTILGKLGSARSGSGSSGSGSSAQPKPQAQHQQRQPARLGPKAVNQAKRQNAKN
jgi:tetratricopeptide (TPR) repeat protein